MEIYRLFLYLTICVFFLFAKSEFIVSWVLLINENNNKIGQSEIAYNIVL